MGGCRGFLFVGGFPSGRNHLAFDLAPFVVFYFCFIFLFLPGGIFRLAIGGKVVVCLFFFTPGNLQYEGKETLSSCWR